MSRGASMQRRRGRLPTGRRPRHPTEQRRGRFNLRDVHAATPDLYQPIRPELGKRARLIAPSIADFALSDREIEVVALSKPNRLTSVQNPCCFTLPANLPDGELVRQVASGGRLAGRPRRRTSTPGPPFKTVSRCGGHYSWPESVYVPWCVTRVPSWRTTMPTCDAHCLAGGC